MAAKTTTDTAYVARLKSDYNATYAKELQTELELKNPHQVPRLEKIVVNVGLGRAKDDKKIIETAKNTLRKITAQEPIETVAKNSIAGFKLREGNKIGLKVTLRGNQMYEFADRLINIVLPRLRDFHGVKAGHSTSLATTVLVLSINPSSPNLRSKKPPLHTACKLYSSFVPKSVITHVRCLQS